MKTAFPAPLSCLVVLAAIAACSDEPARVTSIGTDDGAAVQAEPTDSDYVGSAACGECHTEQATLWQRSHHANAMARANSDSVLGDFNEARFDYGPYFAEFFVRDNRYWLRTNDLPRQVDPAGDDVIELEVLYTFGFEPLQQYLVETARGHLQAFNISSASDAEPSGWFDLYEGQKLSQNDTLQWSSELHNWNSRCATCHVTEFQKNFDAETSTYASEWAAIIPFPSTMMACG